MDVYCWDNISPNASSIKARIFEFFHHLPNIAGAPAYTPAICAQICAAGFSVPGIHKLNVKQIMSIWPGWGELGEGEQPENIILEQITEMSILQGSIEGTTTDALNQEFSGYWRQDYWAMAIYNSFVSKGYAHYRNATKLRNHIYPCVKPATEFYFLLVIINKNK